MLKRSRRIGGANSRIIGDPVGLGMMLRQVGDKVVKHAVDVMRDESENIAQLAREYAPVDKGDLEGAITVEENRGGINRRAQLYVYVNGDHPDGNRAGRTVGSYMWQMHEGLAPYGTGAFHLGPRSEAKRKAGFKVGGKFMERAYKEREPFISARVFAMVQRAIASGKL